jgi:UDP-N-acetylmuramoyl-tripeptide--D-alanyl-D-alanine ligase
VPAGAAVIVVADTLRALGDLAAFHRRRFAAPVVAITGSVGKTTTKELTAAGLEALGLRVLKSAGNLNNLVGVPMTLLGLEKQHEAAVIEIGMNVPGEIARLAEIALPDVAVVTAVAEVHTEGVGSLDGVAKEKGALLVALDPEGAAVHTADDASLAPWVAESRAGTKISFGTEESDVRLLKHEISHGRTVAAIGVRALDAVLEVELSLLGEGPARSATAALAAILALRGAESAEAAVRGFASVKPREGRARPLQGPHGSTILDDAYNASPRSTSLALRTASDLAAEAGGRPIAVLGDMKELGAESERLHEEVGAAAVAAGIAILVCCGEEMRAAARGALTAATSSGVTGIRIESVLDPAESIELLRDLVQPGDVVLVKGSRSMAMERVVDALRADAGLLSGELSEEEAP